jgi:N-acetylated-alpha-linked acidic dipeptidase
MAIRFTFPPLAAVAAAIVPACPVLPQPALLPEHLDAFPPAHRGPYIAYENSLNAIPAADRLRAWHDLLAAEPHVAGTEGDRRMVETLARVFEELGLRVERHEILAYLPAPLRAEVAIVAPDSLGLPLREEPVEGDPAMAAWESGDPRLAFAWNGYSGSGEAVGHVVYANYGTDEDFDRLAAMGVEIRGSVVLARYGANYRGFKARYAEAHGAAALLLYTDPADEGYVRGLMYPEGGFANGSYIQRGSLNTLGYPGDPLTPFVEATPEAPRLDPRQVGLPGIPVQPIGFAAAHEIMKRMRGPAVPEGWQGGLPLTYRLSGGDVLRVRVSVAQDRALTSVTNVLGYLEGALEPERMVIIGCHHDAWGCGASDATSGMIALLESARSFCDLARQGRRPARTLVFAAWGAEEMGIIGSTEWVEGNRERLVRDAVAYINLDMASMGPEFGSSAWPGLHALIRHAAAAVPQARDPARSVLDAWSAKAPDPSRPGWARFGDLGGGSDHIGFLCHAAVASASLGGGGSRGTAYHSVYDTLAWYRAVVGDDYEPALMVARMTNAVVARLASAPMIPLDPSRFGGEIRAHLRALTDLGERSGLFTARMPGRDVAMELARIDLATLELDVAAQSMLDAGRALLERLDEHPDARGRLDAINAAIIACDRAWLDEGGLPGRAWFRNLYVASDPRTGYAPAVLPALRRAVEQAQPDDARHWAERYEGVVRALAQHCTAATAAAGP